MKRLEELKVQLSLKIKDIKDLKVTQSRFDYFLINRKVKKNINSVSPLIIRHSKNFFEKSKSELMVMISEARIIRTNIRLLEVEKSFKNDSLFLEDLTNIKRCRI